MSSNIVRNFARALVQHVIPEAPFQKTISTIEQQKNLPEVWCTLEFTDAGSQRLSVGVPALWREYGSFSVVVLGKAGFGEEELTKIGEKFARFARDLQQRITEPGTNITGKLRLENVGTPNAEPYEDGNWASCSVVCTYTYDSVRGAAE